MYRASQRLTCDSDSQHRHICSLLAEVHNMMWSYETKIMIFIMHINAVHHKPDQNDYTWSKNNYFPVLVIVHVSPNKIAASFMFENPLKQ